MNPEKNTPNPKPEKSSSIGYTLIILLIILALLIGGYYYFNPYHTQPSEIAKAQIEAIRKNDWHKAYEYTSKEYQQKNSLENFKGLIQQFPAITSKKEIVPQAEEIEQDSGTVLVVIEDENGIPQPIIYNFKQEGNKWKIANMQILNRNVEPGKKKVGLVHSKVGKALLAQNDTVSAPKTKYGSIDYAKPKAIVEKMLQLLKDGDAAKAYNEFASVEFKEYTSLDSFKEFVQGYPEFKNDKAIIEPGTLDDERVLFPVTFEAQNGKSHAEFRLVTNDNAWKVWGIRFIDSAYDYALNEKDKQTFLDIINKQLKEVQEDNIANAYRNYTSPEFQEATSLQDFKTFLSSYPAFKEYKKIDVADAQMKGNLALMQLALESPKDIIEVDYRFVKINGQWKVWGILVVQETPIEEGSSQQAKEKSLSVINDQLAAIKEKDFSKAYYAYTSQGFQDASSFNDFVKFMEDHPFMAKIKNFEFSNISGGKETTITGFYHTDSDKIGVEYRLVSENQRLKILSLQLIDNVDAAKNGGNQETSSEESPSGRMEFSKALFGTKTDLNGIVTKPTTEFTTDDEDITFNLFITGGKKGAKLTFELEHLETKSKIPAIETAITKNGDSVISIIFSPPTQGWPEGDYKVWVSSDTGVKKDYSMRVEED